MGRLVLLGGDTGRNPRNGSNPMIDMPTSSGRLPVHPGAPTPLVLPVRRHRAS
jgi:hypothetical protein